MRQALNTVGRHAEFQRIRPLVAAAPRPVRLQGKTVMVTGGSRGIGRAVTLGLAEAGAAVVVNYRH